MKNANTFEEMAAKVHGFVNYGVVYDSPYGLVHRKKVGDFLATLLPKNTILVESVVDDTVFTVLCKNLSAVYKGPSNTPKKPKRKHIKGTKPWTKIPYKFEDVDVGDTVGYTIDGEVLLFDVIGISPDKWVAKGAVGLYWWKPDADMQAHIIKPYKEPIKTEDNLFNIGDKLKVTDTEDGFTYECLLAQTTGGVAQLICLDSGNRINDNRISFLHNIKAKQIQKYLGDIYKFEIMEDKQ